MENLVLTEIEEKLETDELFEDSPSLILKEEYPFTIEYIPTKLIGRNAQIDQIVQLVNPLMRNGKPHSGLIYGKTGSGKTVVVKFVLNKLVKKFLEKPHDYKFMWIYVPCKQVNTTTEILYYLLTEINPFINISSKGHSLNTYYTLLWKEITDNNLTLIVVLDEIDRLQSDEILYNLSRAGEEKKIPERRYISIIGISNSLNYIDTVDPRIRSSSGFYDIVFEPYNTEQIYSILRDRVELAFKPNVITAEVLYTFSSRAAKADGDARKAIDGLRAAAILADKNQELVITEECLNKAVETLNENKFLKLADTLPLHNKLVLLSVFKLSGLPTGKRVTSIVTEVYNEMCKKQEIPSLKRTSISGIITELEMLGFFKLKERHGMKKRGRTREIEFADKVPIDLLKDILYTDYNLEGLDEFVPTIFMHL
jgi:archaeal cell division control protein 6